MYVIFCVDPSHAFQIVKKVVTVWPLLKVECQGDATDDSPMSLHSDCNHILDVLSNASSSPLFLQLIQPHLMGFHSPIHLDCRNLLCFPIKRIDLKE